MNRRNFPRAAKVEILKRSLVNGIPTCEAVAGGVRCAGTKGLNLHHDDMDAMVLDEDKAVRKLAAADGRMLCKDHHDPITKEQRGVLKKVLRVEAKHIGATKPKGTIQSAGFAKAAPKDRRLTKIANGPSGLARRFGL